MNQQPPLHDPARGSWSVGLQPAGCACSTNCFITWKNVVFVECKKRISCAFRVYSSNKSLWHILSIPSERALTLIQLWRMSRFGSHGSHDKDKLTEVEFGQFLYQYET